MDRIGLPLQQVAWLHHLGVMEGSGMRSRRRKPCPHSLRLTAIGGLHRRNGPAMAEQGHDAGDRVRIGAPTKEACAGVRKGLVQTEQR
jgi:hypothetical protein